jgi:hypothetical protein
MQSFFRKNWDVASTSRGNPHANCSWASSIFVGIDFGHPECRRRQRSPTSPPRTLRVSNQAISIIRDEDQRQFRRT